MREVYGPYARDNRKKYVVIYENGKRRTQTFSRYLMEKQLGRPLRSDEHVDHVDGDKTNDAINNLQILTTAEEKAKSARLSQQKD